MVKQDRNGVFSFLLELQNFPHPLNLLRRVLADPFYQYHLYYENWLKRSLQCSLGLPPRRTLQNIEEITK